MFWFMHVTHFHQGISFNAGKVIVQADKPIEAYQELDDIENQWKPEADDIYYRLIGYLHGPYVTREKAQKANPIIPMPSIARHCD